MTTIPPVSTFRFKATVARPVFTGDGETLETLVADVPASMTLKFRFVAGQDGPKTYRTVETLMRPPAGVRILQGDRVTFQYPYDETVTVQEVTEYRTQTGRVSHFRVVAW